MQMEFLSICPVPETPKPFGGVITIDYTPSQEWLTGVHRLVDWDSLQEWIKSLKSEVRCAESVAHDVFSKFIEEVDPNSASLRMDISSSFHLPVSIELTYERRR